VSGNKMLESFIKEMDLISNEGKLENQRAVKNDMNKEIMELKDEMNKIENQIAKLGEKMKETEIELETIHTIREQKKTKLEEQKQLIGFIKDKIKELTEYK
jgi:chromosome segregation ATPase